MSQVVLFEGHAFTLAFLCHGADLLIVEAGMLPYLHPDWERLALAVLGQANILPLNLHR